MAKSRKEKKPSPARVFAQIENVSIAGMTFRASTIGLHVYGEQYLSAAKALSAPEFRFEPVRPYLVCHAIELFLKASLSITGQALVDLSKDYGHKLASLLSGTQKAGLSQYVALSDAHCQAVRDAELYYNGKVFEYPAIGEVLSANSQMPPLEILIEAAERLCAGLASPCMCAH